MGNYFSVGIIVVLLVVVGVMLILRSRSVTKRLSLRWLGYLLLIMAVFLIVVVWLVATADEHIAAGIL